VITWFSIESDPYPSPLFYTSITNLLQTDTRLTSNTAQTKTSPASTRHFRHSTPGDPESTIHIII
jgi:hypothetical protein